MSIGRLTTTSVLIVLAGFLLAGPGLRWVLQNEIQLSLGIRLESMESTKVSLSGQVEAHHLVIQGDAPLGSEGKPTHTAVDRVLFQISPQQFMRRRIQVEGAIAQGIHFGDQPDPQRCLTQGDQPQQVHPVDWFPNSIIGGQIGEVWQEFQQSIAIEEESRKAEAKWKASVERIHVEQDAIEKRIALIKSNPTDSVNPLRDNELLRLKVAETKELSELLNRLSNNIQQTEIDLKKDRKQVLQAQQADLERLASQRFSNGLDSRLIGRSILIELGRSTLAEMQSRVDVMSGLGLQQSIRSSSPIGRGNDAAFGELAQAGRLSLKNAKWDGDVSFGGKRFQLEGVLQGITTQSDSLLQLGPSSVPARIISSAKNDESEIYLTGTNLHGDQPGWDTYEARSPKLGFSSWRLGNQQGMQIVGKGEPMSVQVRSFLEEGRKRVEIHIDQLRLQLNVEGSASDASDRLSRQMASYLQKEKELHLTAEVEGDPSDDNNWRVESNLQSPIDSGLREALRSEIAWHESSLREQYRIVSTKIETKLEQEVSGQRNLLVSKVQRLQSEVATLNASIVAKLEGPRTTRFAREPSNSLSR